ncbi:phosphoribosyl-dephospho-CoA transferase [Legionella massiliensis]|uniref:Phosphoribosyl-dephospho-CoA transferase n=1 Tax=Legionella massiliensis TaxID=1034943 RepID=A0A078L0J8_9GAMM|nr:malonate decarboxylase holo-[acyl-carrier-protein] synthase [Legionella massiliensis]CDZ77528.1 phosphoribosyl-dephospho-CoA transferase [Legionella massiliensis]CEE13266.1 Phosphoribosyl-dephospho-CoA transferase [Legionella massiliensis]
MPSRSLGTEPGRLRDVASSTPQPERERGLARRKGISISCHSRVGGNLLLIEHNSNAIMDPRLRGDDSAQRFHDKLNINPQRHDLVFADPNSEFRIHSCQTNQAQLYEQVRAWFARGLPCIYARQSGLNNGDLNLGLPLIAAGQKQRIGLQLREDAVLRYQSLPKLNEMESFDFSLLPSNGEKVPEGRMRGVGSKFFPDICHSISVYGSFLFHYLSGQPYVNEASDLDLLIEYSDYSLAELNELVAKLAKVFNRTIDGEIRFAGLGDVAVQELVDLSARQILLKTRDSVELIARTVLYERYPSLQTD